MRVADDQRFVVRKRHSWNIFEQVVTVAYQISLETNCVEVSFLVKLHDWGSATFLRKQLTALDMVLNTPLSHKLSTYYYNADVKITIQMIIEAVVQRSSVEKMFLKISQNSEESTCARAFFDKVKGLRQSPFFNKEIIFKKTTLVQVFSCEFYEISKTPFFIEHLWWLLL